jgi:diacylglycerol O-acyltransferase
MKHLSGVDNLFLALETADAPLHVASLSIYDPSSAPGGKVRFKAVLNHFESRMHQWKQFRRKLVELPLGIDRPYWVEEPEIDLEYHVRHIALPRPGDWRQLMIQVARIHSRPLDKTKPLWEAYVIEGLDNVPGVPPGGFALYVKVHHSAVDGEAGAQLVRALHSLTPEPDAEAVGEPQAVIADREPTRVELYARAIGNRTNQVLDAYKLLFSVGSRLTLAGRDLVVSGKALETGKEMVAKALSAAGFGAGSESAGGGRKAGGMSAVKPQTRFDGKLSPHRVVDAVGLPMAQFAQIRTAVEGTTINDIFLATVGGAVRQYLEAKDELSDKSLVAMVPVSTRGEVKDIEASNQISLTAIPIGSDVAGPLERLRAVRRGSGKSKALNNALGKDLPARLLNILPAAAMRLLVTRGLMSVANITVSNVRGPEVPLYLAGARLHSFLPVSAIFPGLGLNITGFSYHGTMWVCAVASRRSMPDPAFFAECLQASFDELVDAATTEPVDKAAPAAAAKAPKRAPSAFAKAKAAAKAASPRTAKPAAEETQPASATAAAAKAAGTRKTPRKTTTKAAADTPPATSGSTSVKKPAVKRAPRKKVTAAPKSEGSA